jgi:2,3,4,5-tetrahydropyridine-2,6-dicarboxylate N-succinyltransferase
VLIEDDVMIGGNCGVYDGTIVKRRAVLGAGTIITGSTPIYDIVHGHIHHKHPDHPMVVPEGAVVVPGSRAIVNSVCGKDWNLSLYTPVIVKYRDDKTDLGTKLEELLR